MAHFNNIGAKARGTIAIVDVTGGRGAYECFELDTEAEGDNAQKYAWLAGKAYWGPKCNNKAIKDPAVGIKGVGGDEALSSGGPCSPQCGGTAGFQRDAAISAIRGFRNDPAYTKTVIFPPVSFGTGQSSDGRGKGLGVDNSGASNLWLSSSFADSSCIGSY